MLLSGAAVFLMLPLWLDWFRFHSGPPHCWPIADLLIDAALATLMMLIIIGPLCAWAGFARPRWYDWAKARVDDIADLDRAGAEFYLTITRPSGPDLRLPLWLFVLAFGPFALAVIAVHVGLYFKFVGGMAC